MNSYLLNISSKNEKSLNNFTKLVLKNFKDNNLIKKNKKKIKKKRLTMLKSPHVNKTAQEQFESKIFSINIYIYSTSNINQYIYLKKIIKKSFHDIKITIKYLINNKYSKQNQFKIFKIKNFKLNSKKKNHSAIKNKKLKSFFKLANILGEILIK